MHLQSIGNPVSDLEGKRALVTGASKGIGAGIARALGAAGATVVVGYSSDEGGAARTVDYIKGLGGRALAIRADVSHAADVKQMFDQANAEFGSMDVLVNNAATYSFQQFADVTAEEFHRHYDTNVLGLIFTTQGFIAQASPQGGSIINVLTSDISVNRPGSALYTSTKGAAAALTRTLANELGPQRIRVNAIAPGATDTEGARAENLFGGDLEKQVSALTPLGRVGTPEDIGPVAVFLASADARWITGDVLYASGGLR